jgi:hypothetical protein
LGFLTLVKAIQCFAAVLGLSMAGLHAQGPRPGDLGASPQPVGDAGVAWYTTWVTAFCLLAPDGKKRLSGTGRSPSMGLRTGGRRGNRDAQGEAVIKEMARIADNYPGNGDADEPVVQDFHSFRQALNVASADQRLLLFVAASGKTRKTLRESLLKGECPTAKTATATAKSIIAADADPVDRVDQVKDRAEVARTGLPGAADWPVTMKSNRRK